MKRSWTIIGIVTGAVLLLALIFAGSYNELVQSRETVRSSINNLQSQYQRRADLVPNLVATVKGAANFEQTTLTEVVEARAKATQITLDPSTALPLNSSNSIRLHKGELSQALGRLLVVVTRELSRTEGDRGLS
jgi:LemA protein